MSHDYKLAVIAVLRDKGDWMEVEEVVAETVGLGSRREAQRVNLTLIQLVEDGEAIKRYGGGSLTRYKIKN